MYFAGKDGAAAGGGATGGTGAATGGAGAAGNVDAATGGRGESSTGAVAHPAMIMCATAAKT